MPGALGYAEADFADRPPVANYRRDAAGQRVETWRCYDPDGRFIGKSDSERAAVELISEYARGQENNARERELGHAR